MGWLEGEERLLFSVFFNKFDLKHSFLFRKNVSLFVQGSRFGSRFGSGPSLRRLCCPSSIQLGFKPSITPSVQTLDHVQNISCH